MSGKGQKEACVNFQPQAWRKNLCKNCFKTKPEHTSSSETGQTAVSTTAAEVKSQPAPVLSAKITKTECTAANKPAAESGRVNRGKPPVTDKHTSPPCTVQRTDDSSKPRNDKQTPADDQLVDECTAPVATAVAAAFASSAKTKFTSKAPTKADDGRLDTGRFISSANGVVGSECKVSEAKPGVLHSERGTDVSQSGGGRPAAVVTKSAAPCASEINQPVAIQYVTTGDNTRGDKVVTPDKTTVGVSNTGSKDDSSLDNVNNLKNTELVFHATEQQTPVFISASHGTNHEEFAQAKKELCAARRRQRRRRQSAGDIRCPPDGDELPPGGRVSMEDVRAELNRKEAMREGARMLLDNMREKVIVLEDRCERLDREKTALGELLTAKKRDCAYLEDEYAAKVATLEEHLRRSNAEKNRLVDRLRLPESERSSLTAGEHEIEALQRRLEESEQAGRAALDDNSDLRQEVRDLQLEMDEMHDQFRDDEAIEFRELQKELETAAKNCRILQFKLRRTERRAEQLELERVQQGESLRRLEHQGGGGAAIVGDNRASSAQFRELEEDLRMAKEVSVRLHDELDLVEEKRARYEEELGRVNDLLTESECRRHNMQQELEMLERKASSQGVGGRETHPKKADKSKRQAAHPEYDTGQLLRDLTDSLERENDLKEQLKFAEGEARTMRKKLSDLEEENESINLQLQKISSAKRGKFSPCSGTVDNSKSERGQADGDNEADLRLRMELTEQEVIVLHRKLEDLQSENEALQKEVTQQRAALESFPDKAQAEGKKQKEPYGEKEMKSMAKTIDKLKHQLIEKDTSGRGHADRRKLKKSRSLDEDIQSVSPNRRTPVEGVSSADPRVESAMLQEKLQSLAQQNDSGKAENRVPVPHITADDTALQNIDLRQQVASVEHENSGLRAQLRSLDDRTSELSRAVVRTSSHGSSLSESVETRDLRDQLVAWETTCAELRKTVTELETRNAILTRELHVFKGDGSGDKKTKSAQRKALKGLSKDDLKTRICTLEEEFNEQKSITRIREEENQRLESEINIYREDIDKMMDAFRQREIELIDEIDNLQQKNNVLSNLLDLVSDRAESAQKELDKFTRQSATRSDRSPSVISCVSDVSLGSDEVFAAHQAELCGKQVVTKDWEDQLRKRTECLENLLAEEREKLAAAEKKLKAKDTTTVTKKDKALQEREKEIKDKEFSLSQRQLAEANDQIKELKKTIEDLEKAQAASKSELEALTRELEAEKKKKTPIEAKEPRVKGSAASWRWEKQDLERQLKDARKRTEDVQAELKKAQRKTSLDDGAKDNKARDKAPSDKQLKELKDKCTDLSKQLDDEKKRMEELQSRLATKTKDWETEKQQLESSRKSAEKEAKQKAEAIKLKDDIIHQKDDVILQKDSAIKDRDKSLKEKTSLCQQKSDDLDAKTKQMKQKENELREAHVQVKDLNAQLLEREKRVKSVDEDVRKRDNRIKEKDEALEKLNRQFTEKENSVSDMDNTIRQVMRKLQEKENDVTQMSQSLKTAEQQTTSVNEKVRELKQKLESTERDRAKEKESVAKLESELELMKKEKGAILQELQKVKEQLKDKEDKWRKEKSKIELEMKQAKGKMNSRDMSKTMRESDAIKALTDEKESLISEKHQLVNDNSKLKKESKNATKQWNSERDDLQKIISEKSKLIDDNSAICTRLEEEIRKLKAQQPKAGSKPTPITVLHESSSVGDKNAWVKEKKELMERLEAQQQTLTAERNKVEEGYAAKLRIAQDQCTRAQDRVACLTKENEAQMELLQSSRRTISEVKQKYEGGVTAWNKEKQYLEAKAKELEQKKTALLDLEKALDRLKAAAALCTCCKPTPASEKAPAKTTSKTPKTKQTPAAKTAVTAKPVEEPAAGSATKISAFRARFEQFEKPQKKAPVASTTTATPAAAAETKKAEEKTPTTATTTTSDDADTLVKELREQVEELQSLRKKDKKEGVDEGEKRRKEWTKERREYQERLKELLARCSRLDELDSALVALKCQSETALQRAQEESRNLSRELDDSKREHLESQQITADLKAEVDKLKSVAPLLMGAKSPSGTDSPSTSRRSTSRGTVSNRLPIGRADSAEQGKVRVIQVTKATGKRDKTAVRSTSEPADKTEFEPRKVLDQFWRRPFSKALGRISRLLEDSEKHRKAKRGEPPESLQFRRCLSTSEVEALHPTREPFSFASPGDAIVGPSSSAAAAERPSRSRAPVRRITPLNTGDAYRYAQYASGSQSAYTSRDPSPSGSIGSPYPQLPPNMIITPSHTPNRSSSTERRQAVLSSTEMALLHDKLCQMERGDANARGVLMKSVSCDADDGYLTKVYPAYSTPADSTQRNGESATTRSGRIVISPGVERQSSDTTHERSRSMSPKSARRYFYESYDSKTTKSSAGAPPESAPPLNTTTRAAEVTPVVPPRKQKTYQRASSLDVSLMKSGQAKDTSSADRQRTKATTRSIDEKIRRFQQQR